MERIALSLSKFTETKGYLINLLDIHKKEQ